MRTNFNFNARVAVGVLGVALLDISETVADGFRWDGDLPPNVVSFDAGECGIEDWWDHIGGLKKPGIYRAKGSAHATEDDIEYVGVEIVRRCDA